MKERPILFSGPMVRAILEGRKTQLRRVLKPQILALYGLTDDRISVIHSNNEAIEQCFTGSDTSIAKYGLHGWKRWSDLLKDQVCWVWSQGIRGLVSIERINNSKGIPMRISVSQQYQGHKKCAQVDLHGIPWNAGKRKPSSKAFRWESIQQHSMQFEVGNAGGELERQKGARSLHEWRESSRMQINKLREKCCEMVRSDWFVQPTKCCEDAWDYPIVDLVDCPWQERGIVWVRETWGLMCHHDPTDWMRESIVGIPESELRERYVVEHAANWNLPSESSYWRPSIHMPRWASRITLEIVSVRIERLQDITEEDAKAEGVEEVEPGMWKSYHKDAGWIAVNCPITSYRSLWKSINGPGSWDLNPWVWVIEFKEVTP